MLTKKAYSFLFTDRKMLFELYILFGSFMNPCKPKISIKAPDMQKTFIKRISLFLSKNLAIIKKTAEVLITSLSKYVRETEGSMEKKMESIIEKTKEKKA